MFSWASSQFEKLSLAVAPPPTDPVSRFVFFMQKQSEEEALQCVMEMPDIIHMVVNPTKGSYAIHLACQNSMMRLTQHILAQTNNIHVTDGTGNTALHYAALSQRTDLAVAVCRMLVTDFGASVLTKNAMGQTPYDVATLTSVRQYLLPLQLQLETQQALDNGGVGLPPGIDLGGLRIQQNMATVGPPPPTSFGSGGASVSGPPYGMTATATPTAAPGAGGPPHMFATPNPMSPPPVNYQPPQGYQTIAPAPATMPAPVVHQHYPAPTSQGSAATTTTTTTPAAATENGNSAGSNRRYARTGSSSAALDSISGRVRPDGFHSSSSDVNLQKKYGHVSVTRAVPPPPTSGNAGPINSSGSAAVPGGANPFSAGGAVLSGGVHRYAGGSALPHGNRRYPVYDAISRSASSSAAPHSAPLATVASSMPNFSVFTPGGAVPAASNASSWSQPQQQQAQPHEYAAMAATQQQQQQQPYAAAPLSGSASASQWQQQQPSWQAGYYSQPNTSTWQSNPNLYEEASAGAPPVEQQPQQQSWPVGYDYGASQGVSQPSVGVSQDVPTIQSPFQQPPPQAAAAADVFFAPPPQAAATTATTATQPWGGLYNKGEQESEPIQAAVADAVVASQPEFSAEGVEQQSNTSDTTPYVDPASVTSAAPLTTAGLPPRGPEPVSLIGTFNAEVRTVSGSSNVAEDFFSASGPVPSSTAVTSVAAPAFITQQPIARAPGSWGISPAASLALNGGHVAAGDFFSSPPAQQHEQQQEQQASVESTTFPIQETPPAVDPVAAEAVAEEQFPPAPVSSVETTTPTASTTILATTSQEAAEASTFAISNCGPFSEPNATVPLNAAALFSQGLSQQPAATAASLFDRRVEATTATIPPDAAALFSPGTSLAAATTTATSLFDPPSSSGQPLVISSSGGTEPIPDAASLFSQGPGQQPTAASLFGQPPAKLNETFGLSGLGGAEAFEATTKPSAPELFANGPAAEPSVNTETTPTDDELSDAMHNSVLGDDELFDVALSPNSSAKKAVVVLETEANAPASTATTTTTTTTVPQFNGAESLFAAIGLPPPPFSSKR